MYVNRNFLSNPLETDLDHCQIAWAWSGFIWAVWLDQVPGFCLSMVIIWGRIHLWSPPYPSFHHGSYSKLNNCSLHSWPTLAHQHSQGHGCTYHLCEQTSIHKMAMSSLKLAPWKSDLTFLPHSLVWNLTEVIRVFIGEILWSKAFSWWSCKKNISSYCSWVIWAKRTVLKRQKLGFSGGPVVRSPSTNVGPRVWPLV